MDIDLIQILKGYDSPDVDSQVRNLSKLYLKKYWLHIGEFNNYWLSIKNKVFNPDSKDLPELMFNKGFELIAQKAGILFSKEEYYALQKCMESAGDEYFVIIENKYARNATGDYPRLRFKFPVDITWKELNNDDENFSDISSYDLLLNPQKHFFVFGNSGKWGKYTANDYNDTPLDIIGFRQELAPIFQEHFKQPKEEEKEILEWLPQEYKKLIK
ncbi:MAG: hypothetical protein GW823_11325 [Bacteroidetes bacterium]|nr:hypothetical protein [Bacteroidota bacterium]